MCCHVQITRIYLYVSLFSFFSSLSLSTKFHHYFYFVLFFLRLHFYVIRRIIYSYYESKPTNFCGYGTIEKKDTICTNEINM